MTSFHEIIFYILYVAIVIICTVGDYGLYHGLITKKLQKQIKENSEEMNSMAQILTSAIGEKKTRLIYSILDTIPVMLIVILLAGLYFQGKYFQSEMLNRTTLTYMLIEILDGIFVVTMWPSPSFPSRPINKTLIITTIFFSLANVFLLLSILFQIL